MSTSSTVLLPIYSYADKPFPGILELETYIEKQANVNLIFVNNYDLSFSGFFLNGRI